MATLLPVSAIKPTLIDFVNEVILPKSTNWQIAFITFFLLQMNSRLEEQIVSKAKIFADENGNIDLSAAQTNAREALKKAGGKINIPDINWDFDEDDLNKVFEIAKRKAKEI